MVARLFDLNSPVNTLFALIQYQRLNKHISSGKVSFTLTKAAVYAGKYIGCITKRLELVDT